MYESIRFYRQINTPLIVPVPSVPPVVYVGPGDVVSGATGFWGLRAYSSASIGMNVVRLREDGGDTEQDFASVADGGLNLSAISAFKGANNLFIVTLYDQSGGGKHATQATASQQPSFNLSAIGSLPGAFYTAAANQWLDIDTSFSLVSAPVSVSAVARATDNGNFGHFIGSGTSGSFTFQRQPTVFVDCLRLDIAGVGLIAASSSPFGDLTWRTVMASYDNSAYAFWQDGATNGSGTNALSPTYTNDYTIGGPFGWNGYYNELITYGSILDGTDAADLDTNQSAYWGF